MLVQLRALAAARDWKGLVARLEGVSNEMLQAQPEAALLLADALRRIGRVARALEVATGILPCARQSGDRLLLRRLLNVLGMARFETGALDDADEAFGELLSRATEAGDEEFAARASNNLGILAFIRGRHDLALTCYQRALAAYQRLGQTRGLAQTHGNLGLAYRELAFPDRADSHFLNAIELGARSRSEDVVASAEAERAMLFARRGDGSLAETLAHRALERFESIGDRAKRPEILRILAAAARAQDDPDRAAANLEEALRLTETFPNPFLRAEVLRDQGLAARARGDEEFAARASNNLGILA
ncbi:MAG TPA: tetratricopeptide repeat protein, partial [Longimicrobiaceae bacterium]|nr:tetratricopeptide repeat protein [Longimicrobiaceae bacterium]